MSILQGEFVQFINMLLDDEELQKWFISLSKLSGNDRTIELRNMVLKMSGSNIDEAILKIVISLSSDETYNNIRAVMLAELSQRKN